MIYKQVISALEKDIAAIVKTWAKKVTESAYMDTYQAFDREEVFMRGEKLYSNLIKWLGDGASDDVEDYFTRIGAERNEEGFPLSEVIFALYLTRSVLWDYFFKINDLLASFDKEKILELVHVLNNYFDRGNFFITRGYLNGVFAHLEAGETYSKEELMKLMAKGALHKESAKPAISQLYDIGFKIGVLR
ncbi:MAG: hypothetical protein GY765_31060 [bacterium]|nr:hypothetical protein [bacterium]